jgi:hypothetical protein
LAASQPVIVSPERVSRSHSGDAVETLPGSPAAPWAGVQQRPDMAQWVGQARVAAPADQGGAGLGRIQAEDHPHRGGFAGAVRADKPSDLPGRDRERHPVQRQRPAQALAQAGYFNRGIHEPGATRAALTRAEHVALFRC